MKITDYNTNIISEKLNWLDNLYSQRYKENKNKIEDCISEFELIEELSASHLIIYFKYMCITSYYITLNVLLVAKCRQFHRNYLSSIYG